MHARMKNGSREEHAARRWGTLLAGAGIYAVLFALCSQIDQSGFVRWDAAVVCFLAAFPVAAVVLALLFRFVLPRLELRPDAGERKPFCVPGAALLLFCCYVPMFLILYPGSFTYDSPPQVHQIASHAYSTFHPLLHTLLIRFAVSFYDVLQSMERCGAVYSIVQMALVSLCFAQVCASISRSVSRRAARLSLAFFALYPAHMAFACNCTKDVLFAAFFALFLALCFEELAAELSRGRRAVQIACGIATCLMRNNMIYAMAAWAVLMLLCKRRRRLAGCGLLIVALSLGANAGLVAATDAQPGKAVEMLSVPIQQLARARLYAPECFDEAQLELMDAVFCTEEFPEGVYRRYEPTLSDFVKNKIDDELVRENLPALAKLWVSVGLRCPSVYLDAFLNLTLPSLYPYSAYRVKAPYIETGGNIALTAPFGLPPMTRPRRFEPVRVWLDERIFATGADDYPVFRWLFNIGGIFWLLLVFALYDLYRGRWDRVTVTLLAVLLYGTYLLGPVMQGRYLYPFICTLPLLVLRPGSGDIQREE